MKRLRNVTSPTSGSGFTLMEVLLVLAILVILGTLVVTNFAGVFAKSKIKAASAQVSALETQLDIYQLDVGQLSHDPAGTCRRCGRLRRIWPIPPSGKGPYAKKDIPPDPWANAYIYELISPTQYKVYSAGPDGQPNTDDDIGTVSG